LTIRDNLASAIRSAFAQLGIEAPSEVRIDRPARPEHGDWASNVALAVAAGSGSNPRALAASVAELLNAHPPRHVAAVEVAGPGFLNFRLNVSWLHEVLADVIAAGTESYARNQTGESVKVNVEFVSANPTGPLHVGAGRWAAYGDSLCRILQWCGYEAHREYYINDRGTQTTLFGASLAAARAGEPIPPDGYQGAYVADWAAEMPADADPETWGRDRVLKEIAAVLEQMGVHFDTWFSERSMVANGALRDTLGDLAARGHTYEADGATWLRTTAAGLGKDEVLVRTNGEASYYLGDLAYHRDKFSRGFDHVIDILGADHHGHVARMKTGMALLGYAGDELEIVVGQLVTLVRHGEVVRMGKRSGTFVELAEVLDEVGGDVARLTFLLQSIDTPQTFDLDAVVAASMDNPVHYVQYAHARIASIGRMAHERGIERPDFAATDLSVLTHPRELGLLRCLADLPDVVADAATARAPHRVATWVRDLASKFHGFYHDCPVLRSDVDALAVAGRLWLVEGCRVGLAIGLDLLGAAAPQSM